MIFKVIDNLNMILRTSMRKLRWMIFGESLWEKSSQVRSSGYFKCTKKLKQAMEWNHF